MPWDIFRMIWTETVVLCILGGMTASGFRLPCRIYSELRPDIFEKPEAMLEADDGKNANGRGERPR